MSRSREFAGGLVLNYGYQAAIIFTGLWLTPFYLGRIGQHDYGLWLVGTQLLTYLTLTDFGVVALLPLEIGYATGRGGGTKNVAELQQIIGQTFRLVLYQLPVVIAVAMALWLTIPAEWQGLRRPLAMVLIGFVVAFPLRMFPDVLRGLQDLTFMGSQQMVNWVLTTLATVLMVVAGWNLLALSVGWLISQVLLALVCLWRLWRRFPGLLPRRLPPLVWSTTRVQLEKGFWISVSQVATLLMANTDVLIVGKLLGPAAVVPYAVTGKLIMVLANQAQILMQTATPGLCEMRTRRIPGKVAPRLGCLDPRCPHLLRPSLLRRPADQPLVRGLVDLGQATWGAIRRFRAYRSIFVVHRLAAVDHHDSVQRVLFWISAQDIAHQFAGWFGDRRLRRCSDNAVWAAGCSSRIDRGRLPGQSAFQSSRNCP